MKRVVVTGIAGLTPIGNDWEEIKFKIKNNLSGINFHDNWSDLQGLNCRLAGFVNNEAFADLIPRREARLMSRTAYLGAISAVRAIKNSNLDQKIYENSEQVGIAFGSCLGGAEQLMKLGSAVAAKSLNGILASSFLQVMTHSCAVSIAMLLKTHGRIIPTCSACTSASQAIGYAYETIKHNQAKIMLAGGADEFCIGTVAMFDKMQAVSLKATTPDLTPSPFDLKRDGIVISEGACTFILEELEHAKARNAEIIAEIISFETSCDGSHITQPNLDVISRNIDRALINSNTKSEELAFVHAHATGTQFGDLIESKALEKIIGKDTPITATKGYQGHTLGATGAIESWISIKACQENWIPAIKNLNQIDPECGKINYCTKIQSTKKQKVMVNNFAFGGVNTSLIYDTNPNVE